MIKEFDYIKIKLASPIRILNWSQRKLPNGQFIGEVQKSDTINYRTFKPEMDGLFCERIFGPIKNLECNCGKYKHVRFHGLICDRCGVELTDATIRRHRMGYIRLMYPVTHVWYINSRPNFLSLLLEVEDTEKTVNTTYNLRIDPSNKNSKYEKSETATSSTIIKLWDERIQRIKLASLVYFIAEDEISFYGLHWDLQKYRKCREIGFSNYPLKPFPKKFKSQYYTPFYLIRTTPNFLVGSPLIKLELNRLDLKFEIFRTRLFIFICTQVLEKNPNYYNPYSLWYRKWEQQRIYKLRAQNIKRIRILENLIGTGSHPSWIILSFLPVLPPALRPMIQLEGGQFATSDLNELYRRIINRNNRLLRLLEVDAPQLIIRNEKRMLQEAVDSLIDNGRRGKVVLSANNRPLKSLSDIIKGKYGRFRQNLLGKRVDYSGRSVIVVGPTLRLNQCGLPYEMALELFQPFIIRKLIEQGVAATIKVAKDLMRQHDGSIQSIVAKVLINHPIFLNRAPTLHRLGIQAFEPVLVKGRTIKLHPLVCSAFNADFDGDQMAVHIPISLEAQAECYMLLLAPHNFLSPANGSPIVIPSQDMVLGCYYLTVNNIPKLLGSNHYFANMKDVILAYIQNKLELHSCIWLRYENEDLLKKDFPLIKQITFNDNSSIECYKNLQIKKDNNGKIIVVYIQTTTGRTILNYTIQKTFNLV